MTYIFADGEQPLSQRDQGKFAFTLTYEGNWDGQPEDRLVKWGSLSGTLNPEPGESAYQVQQNVREYVRTTHGIVASKIICWDLMENKLPRRGPIE